MDQITELEHEIDQIFSQLAQQLREADTRPGVVEKVRDRYAQAVADLTDVAPSDWNDSAEMLDALLEVGCAQDDLGLVDPSAAGLPQDLLQCLLTGLDALGPALSGDERAFETLRRLQDQAREHWSDALQLVQPLTDLVSIDHDPAPEPEPAPANVDGGQLAMILNALETHAGDTVIADEHQAQADADAEPERCDKPPVKPGAAKSSPAAKGSASKSHSSQPPAPPEADQVEVDPSMLEAYMEDAQQCLASMERLALDNQLTTPAKIAECARLIRRELHTLKGASASLDFKNLATYLHGTEEWLEAPQATRALDVLRKTVLTCVDVVRRHVARLQTGKQPTGGPETTAAESVAAAVGAVSEAPENGETTIRVKTSQIDRLMNLLAELAMLRSRRDGRAAELRQIQDHLASSYSRLRSVAEDIGDSTPASTQQDAESTTLRHRLKEIARELDESLQTFKQLQEPLVDENRAVSQFIGQFRQELVSLRRLPLTGLFRRLQRAAFDAASAEGKQVRFELHGSHAGLERSLQERLFEPLLHMVRNAVSHGIESAEERQKRGKDPVGTVTLDAYGSSHVLVLEITDDGKGLDYEAIRRRGISRGLIPADRHASQQELARLIFHPGFSTREVTTGVSGRGVGMDIVASALERLHCLLEIDSEPGSGTRFRMTLPLYSIIEHVMVFRTAGRLFGVPMTFIKSAGNSGNSQEPQGDRETMAQVNARELLDLPRASAPTTPRRLVVGIQRSILQHRGSKLGGSRRDQDLKDIALQVDEIVGPEEIVVRPLPPLLKHHPFLSGLTMSGKGEVLQLLDGHRLIKLCQSAPHSKQPLRGVPDCVAASESVTKRKKVLVTDDSHTARRKLIQHLLQWNFEICEASGAEEALEMLREHTFDVLFTDLEMGAMSGFDLLEEVKSLDSTAPAHSIMVTSHQEPEVHEKCAELGGKACLGKPITDDILKSVLRELGVIQEDH